MAHCNVSETTLRVGNACIGRKESAETVQICLVDIQIPGCSDAILETVTDHSAPDPFIRETPWISEADGWLPAQFGNSLPRPDYLSFELNIA